MKFEQNLISGNLIRRYKRFLADVELDDGRIITAHTPNTGSMKGCNEPGCRVWLSDSGNPKRKFPLSWELIEVQPGTLVGINTHLANRLVIEALRDGCIEELAGYDDIQTEVRYGNENSRIDMLLTDKNGNRVFVEVKNVTLCEDGTGYFPDAVTTRGSKHLRELEGVLDDRCRAVIFFCVQREDAACVAPADHIDVEYGKTLRRVVDSGVEALAYGATLTPREIVVCNKIPVILR